MVSGSGIDVEVIDFDVDVVDTGTCAVGSDAGESQSGGADPAIG